MEELLFLLFLQIVLESLPVSSSGHVFLFEKIFSSNSSVVWTRVLDDLAHGPTAFIIAFLFLPSWWNVFKRLWNFSSEHAKKRTIILWKLVGKIALLAFICCMITGLFYLVIREGLRDWFFIKSSYSLFFGFIITAVSLLSLRFCPDHHERWNFRKALVLGVVQGLALLPGISRFATTYVAGRWLKLSTRRAFQISFLIEFPLLSVAFVRGLLTAYKSSVVTFFSSAQTWFDVQTWFAVQTLFVVVVATLLGFVALYGARYLAYKKKFWLFGFYMLVPIVVVLLVLV